MVIEQAIQLYKDGLIPDAIAELGRIAFNTGPYSEKNNPVEAIPALHLLIKICAAEYSWSDAHHWFVKMLCAWSLTDNAKARLTQEQLVNSLNSLFWLGGYFEDNPRQNQQLLHYLLDFCEEQI